MSLFQESIIKKHLNLIDQDLIDSAYSAYKKVYSPEKIKNIKTAKEEQYQEGFIKDIFGLVLGYTVYPEHPYNIETEKKNESNSKKADGAILKENKVVGVIELKDNKTKNLEDVKEQAFGYKNNHKECSYVISSNFHKLRFYIDDATDYEEFDLYNLDKESFRRFYLYLRKEGLLDKNIPKLLREETKFHEEDISKKLYKDYSNFKRSFFNNAIKNNPDQDKLILFKKSQKFLDRILFLLFAEDRGLVGTNSIVTIVEKWSAADDDYYKPLYELLNVYFAHLYNGYVYQKTGESIPQFGGELFAPDTILNSLKIDDEILKNDLLVLSKYDFNTDVDVNILGHIFEHSLNELEDIEAETTGALIDNKKSKRKKDGVFYTPKYITKFIVDNTLGKLCFEKKIELNINDDILIFDYQKPDGKLNEKGKILYNKLNSYKEWLLSLKVCDPACGSGAFLNQTLTFFIDEHRLIDNLIAELTNTPLRLFDTDLQILENNIYGVDINEESVEIAKLSLWLRTAKKGRKLSNLSNNIKCGNSLIENSEIAGEKAFNWQESFSQVFKDGGFDLIIGNPPYVDIKNLPPKIVKELFKKYPTTENRINLYSIFIERGYQILKNNGFLSFINPNSILVNSSYTKIRKKLIDDITTIIKLPDNVFEDAIVETIIFEFRKNFNNEKCEIILYKKSETINSIDKNRAQVINKEDWKNDESYNFNIYISNLQKSVISKIQKNSIQLFEIADFSLGITPYDKYKGHTTEIINNRVYHSLNKLDNSYKPLISGGNILRYYVSSKIEEYIKYGDWLGAPREERFFTSPRIIVRQIVSGNPPRIYAGYTEKPLYFTQIGFGIIPKLNTISAITLLCIINSNLINFFHKYSFLDLEKELFQKILIANCKKFPINNNFLKHPNKLDELGKKLIESLAQFYKVETSLLTLLDSKYNLKYLSKKIEDWTNLDFKGFASELKKLNVNLSLQEELEWVDFFNTQKEKALSIKINCESLEKEINNVIYNFYELTEEDIIIIENN